MGDEDVEVFRAGLLTRVTVGDGEVVLRRPGRPTVRFRRGATTAPAPLTLWGTTHPEPVELPHRWLTRSGLERLLARVEAELDVRVPRATTA